MSRRRVAALALGLPVAAVAVLVAEVQFARRGPRLEPAGLDLDGPFGPPAGEPTLHTVWFGDSTAAGIGATERSAAVSSRVAAWLGIATGRRVEVANLAVSGARAAGVLVDQLPRLPTLGPDGAVAVIDVVFVSVGANDTLGLVPGRSFVASYRSILAALPPDAAVVLLGVPDIGGVARFPQPLRGLAGWRGDRMNARVRALAEAHGHAFVDIAAHTRAVARREGTSALVRPDEPTDRFHPTDTGYGVWAEAITAVLEAQGIGR